MGDEGYLSRVRPVENLRSNRLLCFLHVCEYEDRTQPATPGKTTELVEAISSLKNIYLWTSLSVEFKVSQIPTKLILFL